MNDPGDMTTGPGDPDIIELTLPTALHGRRMDQALVTLLPEYTRGTIQGWIKLGYILVDDNRPKSSDKVRGRETVTVAIPAVRTEEWIAQELDLEIVFEDAHLIVVNKPAGLVVHPGAGNVDGTLLNGLLARYPELRGLPRAGIVHRLDKDTTGLMVVARSELARQSLIEQLKTRSVHRRYLAVANGLLITGETIDQPIGRHRHDRLRMAVTASGKPAVTHIRVREKFRRHTLVEATLETGRTHQIRVHMAWRGFALVGDPVYGGKPRPPHDAGQSLLTLLQGFPRQALHAQSLGLIHPELGKEMRWQRDLPEDMETLVTALDLDSRRTARSN